VKSSAALILFLQTMSVTYNLAVVNKPNKLLKKIPDFYVTPHSFDYYFLCRRMCFTPAGIHGALSLCMLNWGF
jgi:hypothetical protein